MTATGTIATAAALAWLAVTLAFQFRPISHHFPVFDRLGLLPRWKFFTQGNGDVDYAIEVRDRHADGTIGAWRPLAVIAPRPRRAFLWFPESHRNAVYCLAIDTLARRTVGGVVAPEDSHAYTTILAAVRTAAPEASAGTARQFALVFVRAAQERSVNFTSPFHPL